MNPKSGWKLRKQYARDPTQVHTLTRAAAEAVPIEGSFAAAGSFFADESLSALWAFESSAKRARISAICLRGGTQTIDFSCPGSSQ
jgi:hypothetical protein